jgi:hypothetical protein
MYKFRQLYNKNISLKVKTLIQYNPDHNHCAPVDPVAQH